MISEQTIQKCKKLITECETILIGAGAGLSTAGGLNYGGKRFTENFPDYIKRYNLTDMYSSAFYPFPSLEEKWGYFSRHIMLNRYESEIGKVYTDLLNLVKNKDYFVLTTNGDAQFFRTEFDPKKIFAPQGDYSKFQCEKACHDTLYDNKEVVTKMVNEQADCKIPSNLIPICPKCNGNLVVNLRMDSNFVEDDYWRDGNRRYSNFVKNSNGKKLLLLELGVGFNTPGIIRYPFESFTLEHTDCTLIRVNFDNVDNVYEIADKSILIKADIAEFFSKLNP